MNLETVRDEINAIDEQLVALFVKRLNIIQEVAQCKREKHLPVLDPAREREILSRVAERVGTDLENHARIFFSTLFDVCRARQRAVLYPESPLIHEIETAIANTPKHFPTRALVACQGTEGAYSQQACEKLFTFPTILYFNTFDDVFHAVEKGLCTYGVLPIENSAAGSVTAVYDLMERHNFHIVRGMRQRINHVLLARKGVPRSAIREVISHPHALAQCNVFFKAHPEIHATPVANTAAAAKTVAQSGREDIAAIASRECAELYGLEILEDDISNVATNYTRFICISKNLEIYPDAKKMSIVLTLPHRPGALYNVMAKFAAVNINLTKLESRPIPGMDFEFRFTFDLEASARDAHVVKLLSELASTPEIEHFDFLGCYAEN